MAHFWDLAERTGIVTGASRGIGQTIVRLLATQGMHLLISGRDVAALEATARLANDDAAESGYDVSEPRVHIQRCDLAESGDVDALFVAAKERFAHLDLLVNNAGMGIFRPVDETSLDDWERVMAVNARGTFLMSRQAFAWMKESGGGRIVNISSVVGLKGYVHQIAYSAAKHAIMGMTKVMAREGQPHHIRVAAICPGGVATEMVTQARPDLNPDELIQPEDVAHAVLFLATQPDTCCTDLIELRRATATPFP